MKPERAAIRAVVFNGGLRMLKTFPDRNIKFINPKFQAPNQYNPSLGD
jgi:hypothetical protein